MNGEIPSVPITTLAGITSLTDCKYIISIIICRYKWVIWVIFKIIEIFFINHHDIHNSCYIFSVAWVATAHPTAAYSEQQKFAV